MAACAREYISNVGEGVECDEYIAKRHSKFRQIKASSSRRGRRLTGSGFAIHFARIVATEKVREETKERNLGSELNPLGHPSLSHN